MARETNSIALLASPLSGPRSGRLRVPPALAVGNLQRPHGQPVRLLEVVGMRERLREGELRHHLGLRAGVDPDLVQRALDRP